MFFEIVEDQVFEYLMDLEISVWFKVFKGWRVILDWLVCVLFDCLLVIGFMEDLYVIKLNFFLVLYVIWDDYGVVIVWLIVDSDFVLFFVFSEV